MRPQQWQSRADLASRKQPWCPVNFQRPLRPRTSFHFRHPEPPVWREVNPYTFPSPIYGPGSAGQQQPQKKKGKDYYFLAPYFRNVMPPPPNPNRLLTIDVTNSKNAYRKSEVMVPCHCKSRSMEDVRTDVVELSEWDRDENGNQVERQNVKGANKCFNKSMENLLVEAANHTSKRTQRYQVGRFIY